jgi:hypothetical protein
MSVDQIKKFLESATEYPDNTPIRIGEQEIPLGSLRQLNASERTTLSERLKGVETKEAELNTRQQSIVDLAQKAQQAYQAAEEARAKVSSQPPPAGTDPFADPWLSPVKEALSKRDKEIEELRATAKNLQATLTQAASIWAQDRWDREYSSLNFGKREKKPTRDEILKYAQEQKLMDRHGMPSISEAWNKMSETDRLEELRKEALERGREEGRMEAMAARVTPPGVSGIGQGPAGPARKINADSDVLGDMYAESLKDPELRQLIEQLGPGMTQ